MRALATDVAAVAMTLVWMYAGTAVVVAQLGDGQSVSVLSVGAVVVLAHLLARGASRLDAPVNVVRLLGAALSVLSLYTVLRIEIAGDVYLWELGWAGDLLSDLGGTLEGHSGDVALVVLLPMAWVFCVARGSRAMTFERLGSEVAIGLLVVLFAALFADEAGAAGAIEWLPVPFMAIALVSLAVLHLQNVRFDAGRPFARAWAMWVVGSLLLLASVAIPTTLVDLGLLAFIGQGITLIAKGLGLVLLAVLLPPLVGLTWLFEQFLSLFGVSGQPFELEMPQSPLDEVTDEENDPAPWTKVAGYLLQFGASALLVGLVLALLWLAFQRIKGDDEDEVDVREAVEMDGARGSIFGGAFGRLRDRFSRGSRGSDAIGRLYMKVLKRAEADGLARPPAATPLEFAPQLDAHFASPTPGTISAAFAVARYGARPPSDDEVDALDREWAQASQRPQDDESS